jgi:hypothetical protein
MEDGTYTAATVAFVNWLRTSGTTVSEKIDLVDMRNQGAGRGVGTTLTPQTKRKELN